MLDNSQNRENSSIKQEKQWYMLKYIYKVQKLKLKCNMSNKFQVKFLLHGKNKTVAITILY